MQEKKTSAEQIHQGKINIAPGNSKDDKLFIDLDVCAGGIRVIILNGKI